MKRLLPRFGSTATPKSRESRAPKQRQKKISQSVSEPQSASSTAAPTAPLTSLPNGILHEIVTKAAETIRGLEVPDKKDLQALLSFSQTNKHIREVVLHNKAFLAAQEQVHFEHELEGFIRGSKEMPSDTLKAHLSRDGLQLRVPALSNITIPRLRAPLSEVRAPKSLELQHTNDSVEALNALSPKALASLEHLALCATFRNVHLLNQSISSAFSQRADNAAATPIALKSFELRYPQLASLSVDYQDLQFLSQAKSLQSLSLKGASLHDNDFSQLLTFIPPLSAWRLEGTGLSFSSFASLLAHSGSSLEQLAFNGNKSWRGEQANISLQQAPKLKEIRVATCVLLTEWLVARYCHERHPKLAAVARYLFVQASRRPGPFWRPDDQRASCSN